MRKGVAGMVGVGGGVSRWVVGERGIVRVIEKGSKGVWMKQVKGKGVWMKCVVERASLSSLLSSWMAKR